MESHRDTVLNALDVFTSDSISTLFYKALNMLGFPGRCSDKEVTSMVVENASFISVDIKKLPLSVEWRKLYIELRSAISELKNNKDELSFFIIDVISKFSTISSFVYPIVQSGGYEAQVRAFTLLKSTVSYKPSNSVLNEWRKYEAYCNPDLKEDELNKAVAYRLELFQNFIKSDVSGPINTLIDSLKVIACLIDASLLENYIEWDYFRYQDEAHSVLAYELDPYDISTYSGVSISRINSLLDYRYNYRNIIPGELLLTELDRQISSYRATSIWNITMPSYLSIIAAEPDIRQANLDNCFYRFIKHVGKTGDDGQPVALGPFFKVLMNLWVDVTYLLVSEDKTFYHCPEFVALYRQEILHRIAYTYYLYLINHSYSIVDIYSLCPELERKEVMRFLCVESNFLSSREFKRLEKDKLKLYDVYEPWEGYFSDIDKEKIKRGLRTWDELPEEVGSVPVEEKVEHIEPSIIDTVMPYLDLCRAEGWLNQDYSWAKKPGTTIYHACLISLVLINKFHGRVSHDQIGDIFKVKNIRSYSTTTKTKGHVIAAVKRVLKPLDNTEGISTLIDRICL